MLTFLLIWNKNVKNRNYFFKRYKFYKIKIHALIIIYLDNQRLLYYFITNINKFVKKQKF